jgi:TPR repeat protein
MYESGRGVAANPTRAIEYYKKGCAAKDEESCASLDYFHVKH